MHRRTWARIPASLRWYAGRTLISMVFRLRNARSTEVTTVGILQESVDNVLEAAMVAVREPGDRALIDASVACDTKS